MHALRGFTTMFALRLVKLAFLFSVSLAGEFGVIHEYGQSQKTSAHFADMVRSVVGRAAGAMPIAPNVELDGLKAAMRRMALTTVE